MENILKVNENVLDFKPKKSVKKLKRKVGLNENKNGSVREINGKVYVDFMYLGERVREPSGLSWNKENAKAVRKLLDKIIVQVESNEFKFASTFPESKKKEFFTELENTILKRNKDPYHVLFKNYVWEWYELRKKTARNEGRTLNGYKGYIERYLFPFFGEKSFGSFNSELFNEFIVWAKEQKYRKKSVKIESIKKYFIVLKMVCKDATIKFGWVGIYDPFFGFKMPKKEVDAYEKIFPFNPEEQKQIIFLLPNHWKPYFEFAFASGVSQGEQRAIKSENIDWEKKVLKIKKAITLDENGKIIEGPCKNKYRKREIRLSPKMLAALKKQKRIYKKFCGKYFFCNEVGLMIDPSNLRKNVWINTLEKANLIYRDMRQTRHSFGTYQLSKGTDPLKIAKVMGHRDAEMVLKVYAKYIDDGVAIQD
jgi:integrase